MTEITDASRRQAIADILDYRDRHRGVTSTPRPNSAAVNDPQALTDILDYCDAQRAESATRGAQLVSGASA